jgi:sugar O-acyltransferase (sialic acid O-acetyltransferase NeuD family)
MDKPLYAIVGAGGFGREVMPVAEQMLAAQGAAGHELVFVVEFGDTAPVNGHRVLMMDEFTASGGERHFNIAIAGHEARRRIAQKLVDAGARPFSIVAPNFVQLAGNQIGEGAIFCPFSMVTSNARIGRFFHANIYSYVAHDCVIGDFVTFAPGVMCNGNVRIEDNAYIGTGVVIREGAPGKPTVIGEGAVVGMGAVVTKSVPPHTTVVGNPAAPMVRKGPA